MQKIQKKNVMATWIYFMNKDITCIKTFDTVTVGTKADWSKQVALQSGPQVVHMDPFLLILLWM